MYAGDECYGDEVTSGVRWFDRAAQDRRSPADGSTNCARGDACVLGYGHRGRCVVDSRDLEVEADAFEPEDHSDDVCPTCHDPDCSRPWGHPTEDDQ